MIHEKIRGEMVDAMKARDIVRLSTLRGLISAFTNELVARGKKPSEMLSDDEAMSVIRRAVRQRKDSVEQFTKGNRLDLAKNEQSELTVLETYMPRLMTREEIIPIVKEKIKALNILDNTKAGMLTGALMKELTGKADGALVRTIVDELV